MIQHYAGSAVACGLDPGLEERLREGLQREGGEFFCRDMQALWKMLEMVIVRSGIDPRAGRDTVDLLNLACGACEEGSVLSAFLGQGIRRVRQFALDLRAPEIGKGKRRYQATERLFEEAGVPRIRAGGEKGSSIEFVADDAIRLAGYGQIPENFDMIFVRHQNLWFDRAVWQRIYDFALHRVAPEGLLVITSYFDREHLEALAVLRSLGGEVLATCQNPWTRKLDYPGKTVDRHVAAIVPGGGKEHKIVSPDA
jgi:hypothetical protein